MLNLGYNEVAELNHTNNRSKTSHLLSRNRLVLPFYLHYKSETETDNQSTKMMAYIASSRHGRPTTTTTIADQISQLCSAFVNHASRCSALRDAINQADESDTFRHELTKTFVPILVHQTDSVSDPMSERYAVLLCSKLVLRNNCDNLIATQGFVPYIQRAMANKHTCISRPACDVMLRLVAYAPTPDAVLWSNDIEPQQLTQVAVDNLTSQTDGNRCLDAIRVLTLLTNSSRLSLNRPLELCEHMVETFYNTSTPFVSKQTAGLIILLTEQDEIMKHAVVRMLCEQADESKPVKASRCWQEVNDVMAFVAPQ